MYFIVVQLVYFVGFVKHGIKKTHGMYNIKSRMVIDEPSSLYNVIHIFVYNVTIEMFPPVIGYHQGNHLYTECRKAIGFRNWMFYNLLLLILVSRSG